MVEQLSVEHVRDLAAFQAKELTDLFGTATGGSIGFVYGPDCCRLYTMTLPCCRLLKEKAQDSASTESACEIVQAHMVCKNDAWCWAHTRLDTV